MPWRQWFSNGFFVAAIYAALGTAAEGARRLWGVPWSEQLSFALDGLPARALAAAGLLERLKDLYREGGITHLGLRAVFGGTTVLLILAVAVVTGLLVWILTRPFRRSPRHL